MKIVKNKNTPRASCLRGYHKAIRRVRLGAHQSDTRDLLRLNLQLEDVQSWSCAHMHMPQFENPFHYCLDVHNLQVQNNILDIQRVRTFGLELALQNHQSQGWQSSLILLSKRFRVSELKEISQRMRITNPKNLRNCSIGPDSPPAGPISHSKTENFSYSIVHQSNLAETVPSDGDRVDADQPQCTRIGKGLGKKKHIQLMITLGDEGHDQVLIKLRICIYADVHLHGNCASFLQRLLLVACNSIHFFLPEDVFDFLKIQITVTATEPYFQKHGS